MKKKILKTNEIIQNKYFISVSLFIIGALIFTFFFRPDPIYQHNQHTKLLHGMAQAGYGYLENDWLANTKDPLPVFSFIIFITYKFLNEYFLYLFYIIILGIFIYSIVKIILSTFIFNNIKKKRIFVITFFTAIMVIHSQFFRIVSYKLFGFNLATWLMERGVADQYMLGRYFQPCQMGVLLLVSIYFFLNNRPYLSSLFIALASVFHSTYMFLSGIITLTYIVLLLFEDKNIKRAFFTGVIAFVIILPVLIYNYIYLGPSSDEALKQSLDIIVNFRIPQHTNPDIWLSFSAYFRMFLVISALVILFVSKKMKLFWIIFVPFILTVILTIFQIIKHNDFIGFLTPWRSSVLLTPLSTSIIVGSIIYFIIKKFDIIRNNFLIVKIVFFIALSGLIIFEASRITDPFSQYLSIKRSPVESFVYKNKKEGDIYLVPDLMDFRLNTGAPVFITKKSHPYKDVEMIEWYDRIKIMQSFYYDKNSNKSEIIEKLYEEKKITHVVLNKECFNIRLDCLVEQYKDNDYIVYKIAK